MSELSKAFPEPDLADLVENFVIKLPSIISSLRHANENEDWDSVKAQAHDLKSVGGGHGFPQITKVAASIEFSLVKNDHQALGKCLDELDMLCKRVVKGVEKIEGQVADSR